LLAPLAQLVIEKCDCGVIEKNFAKSGCRACVLFPKRALREFLSEFGRLVGSPIESLDILSCDFDSRREMFVVGKAQRVMRLTDDVVWIDACPEDTFRELRAILF
jgi:hypothetical protein